MKNINATTIPMSIPPISPIVIGFSTGGGVSVVVVSFASIMGPVTLPIEMMLLLIVGVSVPRFGVASAVVTGAKSKCAERIIKSATMIFSLVCTAQSTPWLQYSSWEICL